MKRELHIYLDEVEYLTESMYFLKTHYATQEALRRGERVINTYDISALDFYWTKYMEYELYLHAIDQETKEWKILHVTPHMPESQKDIRLEHNLQRLFIAGYFDEYWHREGVRRFQTASEIPNAVPLEQTNQRKYLKK